MSHFKVMVIGENPEDQLAPFDENLEMPRYLKYTKRQLIEKGRKEIEDYKNDTYAKFLKNPKEYEKNCSNPSHISYLKKDFLKKLKWTDEQIYQDQINWYEDDKIDRNGSVWLTSNPEAKWDWYELGGRWAGSLHLKDGVNPLFPINFSWGWTEEDKKEILKENRADRAYKKDIVNFDEINCHAVIKDGKWYEKGKMLWWAIVIVKKNEKVWNKEFKKLIKNLPDDTLISIYDCHI